jgi:Fic family protein
MNADPSKTAWPPVRFERRPWDYDPDLPVPRRVRTAHRGDYRAAIPASIAGLGVVPIGAQTSALATEAATEIARFDAEFGASTMAFAPLLLRSESASSSQIEHLTSSARAIALADLGRTGRNNADLIVSNVHAMQAALNLAERLDGDAILAMHRVLMEAHWPDIAGRWREQQVWIGGSRFGPHEADFIPPHHDRVPAAMADLAAFMARPDLPVLTQAAIAHAQFETIHPFPDGNGRVGRALVHALLKAGGLARSVTVPVSAGLLGDTGTYFAALTAYRAGDPEPIVKVMAEATFPAIGNGRRLAADLRATRARWSDLITARRGAAAHRLADLLIQHPVIDMPLVARELSLATSNAQQAIDRLVGDGVLRLIGKGARDRVWEAPEVISALDGFAKRAKRRTV